MCVCFLSTSCRCRHTDWDSSVSRTGCFLSTTYSTASPRYSRVVSWTLVDRPSAGIRMLLMQQVSPLSGNCKLPACEMFVLHSPCAHTTAQHDIYTCNGPLHGHTKRRQPRLEVGVHIRRGCVTSMPDRRIHPNVDVFLLCLYPLFCRPISRKKAVSPAHTTRPAGSCS